MKIIDIKAYMVNTTGWRNFTYVRVDTDEGIHGVGEAFCVGPDAAVAELIRYFADWIIGDDPLDRERIQAKILNYSRFPGGSMIYAAASAIDLALWDIAGKVAGLPVYKLMGGKTRDKVWLYTHAYGDTPEQILKIIEQKRAKYGYNAVKVNCPSLGYHPVGQAEKKLDNLFATLRKELGDDFEICIDMSSKIAEPYQALRFGNLLKPYRPMFIEEPIRPENIEEMARLASRYEVPLATGEQLYTKYDYYQLLRHDGADILQPDVLLAGGITGVRKIAAMAEASYRVIAPHNPLSPLGNCINVHLAMGLPNFMILENEPVDFGLQKDLVTRVLTIEDGYIRPPEEPGWGMDLNYPYLETLPPKKWARVNFNSPEIYNHDGSIHIL